MNAPTIYTPRTDPKVADALIRAAKHWKGPPGIHSKSTDYHILDLEERISAGVDVDPGMEVIAVQNRNEMGTLNLAVIVNRELVDNPAGLKAFMRHMLDTESTRLIREKREAERGPKILC